MSMSPGELIRAWHEGRAARGAEPVGLELDGPSLADALATLAVEGRAAWPGIEPVAPLALAAWIGRRGDAGALDRARAGDWTLVVACAAGSPRALAALDGRLVPAVTPALRRLRLDDDAIDDVLSRFRVALVVGPEGGEPLLHRYGGRGELFGWLRVAAARDGLKAQRGPRVVEEEAAELAGRVADGSDPDAAYQSELYAPLFRDAFTAAIAALEPRERALLAQHHLDGLSIDRLAELHGVHRATAARWLAAARERLVAATRRVFRERAGLDPAGCESVMRRLRADLDLTLRRVLG
jgi:RNA polymerase sigma-70 factor (ECF subfamily)